MSRTPDSPQPPRPPRPPQPPRSPDRPTSPTKSGDKSPPWSPPPQRSRSGAFSGELPSLGRTKSSQTPSSDPVQRSWENRPRRRETEQLLGSYREAIQEMSQEKSRSPSPPPMRSRSSAFSGSLSQGFGRGRGSVSSASRRSAGNLPKSPSPERRGRSSAFRGELPAESTPIEKGGFGRGRGSLNISPIKGRGTGHTLRSPSPPSSPPPMRSRSSAFRGQTGETSKELPRGPDGTPSFPGGGLLPPPQPEEEESRSSSSETQPFPSEAYKKYAREKRERAAQGREAMSAYDAYKKVPPGKTGQHKLDSTHRPTIEELGASDPGYDLQHPSEDAFPRTKQLKKAPYGHRHRLPVHGPARAMDLFDKWSDIGEQYKVTSDINEPLSADETAYCLQEGYEFVRRLGAGSQGQVWEVKIHDDHPRNVAVKILHLAHWKKPGAEMEQAVDGLMRESDIHRRLEHPNIVSCELVWHVHDPKTGFPYVRCLIFMELCGGDIKGLLEARTGHGRKLDEDDARTVIRDVALALEYLHDRNTCHLDIKSHNIMYSDRSGRRTYKLADFGVAREYKSEAVAKVTSRVGTQSYMAPEVQTIGRPQGVRVAQSKPADIYSLACVMAEILCGRATHRRVLEELQKFSANGVPDPQIRNKYGLSEEAAELLLAMGAHDPKQRITISQVRAHKWVRHGLPPVPEAGDQESDSEQLGDQQGDAGQLEGFELD